MGKPLRVHRWRSLIEYHSVFFGSFIQVSLRLLIVSYRALVWTTIWNDTHAFWKTWTSEAQRQAWLVLGTQHPGKFLSFGFFSFSNAGNNAATIALGSPRQTALFGQNRRKPQKTRYASARSQTYFHNWKNIQTLQTCLNKHTVNLRGGHYDILCDNIFTFSQEEK